MPLFFYDTQLHIGLWAHPSSTASLTYILITSTKAMFPSEVMLTGTRSLDYVFLGDTTPPRQLHPWLIHRQLCCSMKCIRLLSLVWGHVLCILACTISLTVKLIPNSLLHLLCPLPVVPLPAHPYHSGFTKVSPPQRRS